MNTPKNIAVTRLHPFEGHPFKVQDNEEMNALIESIQMQGVLTPLIVRPKENTADEYEIVSGHRRFRAAVKAGMTEIPAFIHSVTRDEAAIMLVDSNLHREHLLPSEKAFAYKLKLDAMSRQGYRTDLTSDQLGRKLETAEIIAQQSEDSKTQVRRYIRLTHLIPELLNMMDEGKIAFSVGVELSYLDEASQRDVLALCEELDCTPSYSQSWHLHQRFKEGTLDRNAIYYLLSKEKPNQKERLHIPMDRIRQYFPKSYTTAQMEETIVKLCEGYHKRRMSQER